MENAYVPRAAAHAIDAALNVAPVVVVLRARQTRKTTLVRSLPSLERSPYVTLDDFDLRAQALSGSKIDSCALAGTHT